VVSVRTVDSHLASIYAKTGAANRAEAAAYGVRHGLAPSSPPPDR
jgi:DNA-binding CsgD family transcriptional regulator